MEKIIVLITAAILCLLQVHSQHILHQHVTTVSFSKSSYVINKLAISPPVTLVLNDSLLDTITIRVVDSEGTAIRGEDYWPGPYDVTFTANKNRFSFSNGIVKDDIIVEEDEYFNLIIDPFSLPSGIVIGEHDRTTVIIDDDDSAVVFFGKTIYYINESRGLVRSSVHLSKPLSTDLNVTVINKDGKATGDQDYNVAVHTITFPARVTNMPFYVQVINDDTLEDPEDLTLSFVSMFERRVSVSSSKFSQSKVIIMDDNVTTITTIFFNQSTYSIDEDSGVVQLVLVLSNPLSTNVTVQVTDYVNPAFIMQFFGRPSERNPDYTVKTCSITFIAGTTIALLNVMINDDSIDENNETFSFAIDPYSLPINGITIGYPYQATVTIVDNDSPNVAAISFTQLMYSFKEDSNIAQPVLLLSNPLTTDITIEVVDREGTATEGRDYVFKTYPITFTPGMTVAPINVTIIDDYICGNKTFILTINPFAYSLLTSSVIIGNPSYTTVTILDDVITVSFSNSSYSVSEDKGRVEIALILSKPSFTNIVVIVTDIQGTAAGDGEDYASGPYSIIITAGVVRESFNILISDEREKETDESFTLTIDMISSLLQCEVTVDDHSQTIVNIEDDDVVIVSFNESVYGVNENDKQVQPVLVLSQSSSTDISVLITVLDGSATGGSDYNYSMHVTIPADVISVQFTISIINDDLMEGNEDFILFINPETLPLGVFSDYPDASLINIIDDDSTTVSFKKSSYLLTKSSPLQYVQVILGNPIPFDLTIEVTDIEGNATRGEDYTFGPYYVTFPANASSAYLQNILNDDNIVEKDEYFTLTINSSSLPIGVYAGNPSHTRIIIRDDDSSFLFFESSLYTVDESNGFIQIFLLLSNPLSSKITVMVTDDPGNASRGSDYIAGPYNITIAPGLIRAPFIVNISKDYELDDSEYFNLAIVQTRLLSSNRVTLGSPNQTEVIIIDNAVISVFFNVTTYGVGEKAGTVTLVLNLSIPSSTDITLQVTDVEDTATRGVDYGHGGPYNITIPAGRTTFSFDISIIDDNILEGIEEFIVIMLAESLPNNVILGDTNMSTVTIVDDDTATLRFQQQTYFVDESNDKALVVLTLSNPSSTDIMIEVINTDGSAVGGGEDYHSGPYSVKFIAGMTEIPLNVSIVDDVISERNESFNLLINASSLPNKVSVGDHDQATVTIVDNDVISVFFNVTTYGVGEKAGTVTLILSLSIPSSTDITLQVTDVEDTATRGVDYGPRGPYNVTIPAGRTTVSFDVLILDDNVLEENEEFILAILAESLPNDIRLGNPNKSTVTIVDDDNISVFFNSTTLNVSEDVGSVTIVLLSTNPSSTDITIQVMSNDSNAIGGVDYRPRSYNATIPAGQTVFLFNILIIDDNILEGDENFNLIILAESLPNDIRLGDANMSTVTIVDDDTADISFNKSVYTVNETDILVQPELVLTNPSSTNITIQVTVGGAIDYDSGPYNVTFPAGVTLAILDVAINDDDIVEGNESFTLSIDPSSLPNSVTVGNPGNTTVIVVNDDFTIVSFDSSTYTVYENGGQIQPVLLLSNPSSFDISVNITIIGETLDYDSEVTVIFTAGVTAVQFNISIIDDNLMEEENDSLRIFINHKALLSGVFQGHPYSAVILIIDDDIASIDKNLTAVSFENRTYSVDEDTGAVQPVLVLSNPLLVDATIQILNINGIAIGGDIDDGSASSTYLLLYLGTDYGAGPYSVTFPAGSTRALLNISIIDDDIAESIENFTLFIDPSSLPSNVTMGDYNQTTITILDNDYYTMGFEQSTYVVHEYARLLQIKLLMNDPLPFPITLLVIAQDGSAIGGGIDYEVSRLHMVTANETSHLFDVTIIDDNIFEGNENFSLTISTPSPIMISEPFQATITIVDDDPIDIFFNESIYDVLESDQYIYLVLVLSNPSATDITILVTDDDSTARGGVDYDSGPYNVTFSPGETLATFNVSINDDDVVEGNENFTLSIGASSLPNGVTVINPYQTTVTITDNDFVFFNDSTYNVVERNGYVQPVLVLSKPSSTDITVQVINIDGTATGGGVDYDSGPFTITIPAGEIFAVFNVSLNDDSMIEGNENFSLSIDPSSLPGSIDQATINIVDDDYIVVVFDELIYSVDESSGLVQPVLSLSKPLSTDIAIQVIDNNGTAARSIDYASGPFNIVFPAGMTLIVFNVSINDDSIVEDDEYFTLSINPSLLPSNVIIGSSVNVTMTIIDDDSATVSFEQSSYAVNENSFVVNPVLVVSNLVSKRFNVRVFATDGSATGRKDLFSSGINMLDVYGGTDDYDLGPFFIRFPPKTRCNDSLFAKCAPFIVEIKDDNVYEGNENFILTIQASLPANITIAEPSQTTVTIVDNDPINVFFTKSVYSATERSGFVQFVLFLSNPSLFNITVQVNGTETRNNKYAPGPYSVTFYAGDVVAEFNISVRDDLIKQNDKNFTLIIDPSSLPNYVSVVEPSSATVIVMDDDDCTINKVSIRARPRSTRRTVIRFSSDNVNATYKCSLNGNTFSKCESPLILTNLSKGKHDIKIRAFCFGDSVWAQRSRLEFDIS